MSDVQLIVYPGIVVLWLAHCNIVWCDRAVGENQITKHLLRWNRNQNKRHKLAVSAKGVDVVGCYTVLPNCKMLGNEQNEEENI